MPKKSKETTRKIRVTLVRSAIGFSKKHKGTVKALGLNRLNKSVVHDETPAIKGMLYKVNHLVEIEQVEE